MGRVSVLILFAVRCCQRTTQCLFSKTVSGALSSDDITRDLRILVPSKKKIDRFCSVVKELDKVNGMPIGWNKVSLVQCLIVKPNWGWRKLLENLGYLSKERTEKMVDTLLPLIDTEKRPDRLKSYFYEVARRNHSPTLVELQHPQLDARLKIMVDKPVPPLLEFDSYEGYISQLTNDIEKIFKEVLI